jgi:hypothetical protein
MNYAPGGDPGGLKKYFVQNMRPGLTYYELGVVNGEKKRKFVDAGDPKPLGAMMYFRLAEGVNDVSITIMDADGKEIVSHGKDSLTLKYAGKGDDSFDAGLNRFVWDMRYPLPSSIPGRPPTAIQPIAKPGKYIAKLTVDGKSQTQEFELFINPGEPYTREQTDARFEFWMELYNNVEASSQNVLAALKLKEEVNARVQAMKESGASEGKLEAAEQQAAVIAGIVDKYESTFVPTGRTLAEIINLPAKIFTKMIWLHNMMEVSEGPVTASAMEVYGRLNEARDLANAEYRADITTAMDKFDAVSN